MQFDNAFPECFEVLTLPWTILLLEHQITVEDVDFGLNVKLEQPLYYYIDENFLKETKVLSNNLLDVTYVILILDHFRSNLPKLNIMLGHLR